MITLIDSFNGREISRHRTVLAAVRAQRKHLAAVKRANGSSSYLTYRFQDSKTGAYVSDEVLTDARLELDRLSA